MKNFYTKTKSIFYFILTPLLLLISNLALAQAIPDADKLLPATKLSPAATDISTGLLRQIFGTVSRSGLTGPPTILGHMFNAFNSGILILVGVFLSYTTIRSVMELAQQTGPMGRKFSWWQPIRIALGVGLLVPQSTGYSFLNAIVMWVTLQGVGLANLVWNEAIDYLQAGGVIYTQPVQSEKNQEDILAAANEIDTRIISDPLPSQGGGLTGTSALLKSQICVRFLENTANTYNRNITQKIANNPQNYPPKGSPEYNQLMQKYAQVSLSPSYDDKQKIAYFPGKDYPETNPLIRKGDCGAYSWNVSESPAPGPIKTDIQAYMDAKKTGITQAINDLSSVAYYASKNDLKNIKNDQGQDTLAFDDDFSFNSLAASSLVSAASDYQTIIYPFRIRSPRPEPEPPTTVGPPGTGSSADQTLQESLTYKKLKQDGWIAAARAYFTFVNPPQPKGTTIDTKDYRFDSVITPPFGTGPTTISSPTINYGCGGNSCNNIKKFIDNYSDTSDSDQTKLWKKLLWATVVTGSKETGAIGLANKLNAAAYASGVSGQLLLPSELKDFITDGKFKISFLSTTSAADIAAGVTAAFATMFVAGAAGLAIAPAAVPSYAATGIAFKPLNKGINSVICVWAKNLGITTQPCDEEDQNPVKPSADNPPLLKLQSIGNQMIYESIHIWTKLLQTLGIIAKVFLVFGGTNMALSITAAIGTTLGITIGAGQVITDIFQFLSMISRMLIELPLFMALPIVFTVTGFMMVLGVTLSFYIPLIPFMLFTFGIISWLSFVIEAMIASPIIALAITHPEGPHDLLGRAERSLELLLAVFVRPAAMVFGLIAALIMSYIALDVLNLGFGAIIGNIFFGKGAAAIDTGSKWGTTKLATGAMAQLTNAFIIIIYVYIVIAIMNQCFSLIVEIPAKILRWIGLPAEAPAEMRALGEVQSGVREAGQTAARGGEAIGQYRPSAQAFGVKGMKEEPKEKPPGVGED